MSGAFEVVASGYGVVEGPTLDDEGGLYFSDVPRGGLFRLSPDRRRVETIVEKRKGIGGICLHRDGGVVISGRDIVHVRNGETRQLFGAADCPPPGPVHGFNDLCTDHLGRVLIGPVQLGPDGEKLPQNFVRVDAPHQGVVLYPDVNGSNGVNVDYERRRIYHSETRSRRIIVSHINDDDSVTIERRFSTEAVEGVPDGLRIDEEGCVWVAFYEGGSIVRFSPTGEILHTITPPAKFTTCMCFAGPDGRDLYIGTHDNTDRPELEGCLFLTRAPVAGLAPNRAAI